jgi:hypothetical protein
LKNGFIQLLMQKSSSASSASNASSSSATVTFQINGHNGSIVIQNPDELKTFFLSPNCCNQEKCCRIHLSDTTTWMAFKQAKFDTKFNCNSMEQLQRWLLCPYKVPLSEEIPMEKEAQKLKFEGKFEKYY